MKNIETICIFGDSTAWGAWDKEKGGWVNRLWLYCAKKETADIYNLSISGGTTETILERFESEARLREADAVIFQTGGNDAAFDTDTKISQVSTEVFRGNLQRIVKRAVGIKPDVFFIGFKNCDESKTTPVSWCNFSYTNAKIQEYNGIMKDVCAENGIPFLNPFGLLENSDFEDGLHPNASGHQKIFEAVRNKLESLGWI